MAAARRPRRTGSAGPLALSGPVLGHGASLREIADLLGHCSLATTRIYAAVDVAALREVALPWPQVTS